MGHSLMKHRWQESIKLASLLFLLLLTACSTGENSAPITKSPTGTNTPTATASTPTPTLTAVNDLPIAWPAFDGGGSRSGINTAETILTPANISGLTRLWQQTFPGVVDSSPVELPNVKTAGGTKTLLFATTLQGSLLAIDAATGNLVWRQNTYGPKITNSSPAIDPSGKYVYSYGIDGRVHKYAVGSGSEITGGGWPETMTLMTDVEKGSSSLNIGNGYLYVTTSGYIGDGGHYEGHVVAVNLATGNKTVFNSLCSNIHQLLDDVSTDANYCPDIQSGIWARAGAVIDPVTSNVFVTTGNGPYNANVGGYDYGDTVIELSPDLTKVIDTYTPLNYVSLNENDTDLGSAAPLILPKQAGSSTPYMAVQAGKDTVLKLLNRQNLSGKGGPNHIGGELQIVRLPQKCDVDTQPVAWNDANNVTWVFVANFCGFAAFKVVTDVNGRSSLQLAYWNTMNGSSPFIANGMLFLQSAGMLRVIDPTTGSVLWNSKQASAGGSIGGMHWQSPIVVNGRLYVPDEAGQLTAYGLKNT